MPLFLMPVPPQVDQALAQALPRLVQPAPAPTAAVPIAERLAQPRVLARAPNIARAAETFVRRLDGLSRAREVATPAPPLAAGNAVAERGIIFVGGQPVTAPVHVLGLNQLGDGNTIRASKPQLWSSLLTDGGGRVAAKADVDAGSARTAAITEGAGITALGARLQALVAEEHDGPDRQVAMLRIPALHLEAVWLKGATPDLDVIIPNDGPIAPLVPGKRYTMAEFLSVAKPMADDRIRQTGPTSGG